MSRNLHDSCSRAVESVARLAALHASPILALKRYASLLDPTTEGTDEVNSLFNSAFHLVDFVLRCNGFALKSLQSQETTVQAVRDFFIVAVSALLPRIFAKQTDSGFQDVNEEIKEKNGDNCEIDHGGRADENAVWPHARETGKSLLAADVASYVHNVHQLEDCLQELRQRAEAVKTVGCGCTMEYVLLALTLANWACVEIRFHRMVKGYALLRCSATARLCGSHAFQQGEGGAGTPLASPPTSSQYSGGASSSSTTVNREPKAGEGSYVDSRSNTYRAWFTHRVVVAVLALNDCAKELMLCNCPEALEDARLALLTLTASLEPAEADGETGVCAVDAETQFLIALSHFSIGLAGEYKHPESALISYHTAVSALDDIASIPSHALPFREAARRQRVSSLLAHTSEKLGSFVAVARGKAIAAAAAVDAAAGGPSRGGTKKNKSGPLGASSKKMRGQSGEPRKSGRPVKSSLSIGAEREIVLDVPPIDSVLRSCIRRFGLPVLVLDAVSIDEALALLVPPAELVQGVSPFSSNAIAISATPTREGEEEIGVSDSTRKHAVHASEQALSVTAVMVCMETPLQWAVEAAALSKEPPVTRYSVWTAPPVPSVVGRCSGAAIDAHHLAEALADVGPEQFTSRSRLARFLRLAGKCGLEEDGDGDSVVCTQMTGHEALAAVLGLSTGNAPVFRPCSRAMKPVAHGMPAGFLASSLAPPPAASSLDGAKKGVATAVKLLSNRLSALIKAERAFENRWTAVERIKSALMRYFVPQQLTKLKLVLLEKQRNQAARENYCARVLVRFFRRVVLERPRLQGFLTKNERRARKEEMAAIALQKYGRRWLAVRTRRALEAQREQMVARVTLAQSLYRRRVATKRLEEMRSTQRTRDVAAGKEARAHFAALQIQRVYRGHAARLRHWEATGQSERSLFHHLHDSRHHYATQIQKCVRGMLARRKHGTAVHARRCYGRNVHQTRVLTESSVTIQRYYRGYRVRRQLFDTVRQFQQERLMKLNTGYFFKRYLGPGAVTVSLAMLRKEEGLLEARSSSIADRVVADTGACLATRYADGTVTSRAGHSLGSPADKAAVKIQSAVRRWLAVRRARELETLRSRAIALRKGETYKPFLFDECVF